MLDFKAVKLTLENRLEELSERMDELDDELGKRSDDDFEEMATEAADDEIMEGVGRASQQEVDQIQHALERIRQGTYGKCTKCGCDIPVARLEAVPYASRCIKCAS